MLLTWLQKWFSGVHYDRSIQKLVFAHSQDWDVCAVHCVSHCESLPILALHNTSMQPDNAPKRLGALAPQSIW